MNTKHTPGPWTIDGKNIKHYTDNGFTKVARVGDYMAARNDEANARLIAAAPDQNAELIRIEAKVSAAMPAKHDDLTAVSVTFTGADLAKLRAIIAKATCETI